MRIVKFSEKYMMIAYHQKSKEVIIKNYREITSKQLININIIQD